MDTPGNPEIIRVYTREKHDEWKKREKETEIGGALEERGKRWKKEMEEKRKDMDRRKEKGEENGKLRKVKKKARGE